MADKVTKQNIGSEWRKWDLHLHSLHTNLENKYGSTTKDSFIKKITDSNLDVIGLTNYFKFSDDDFKLKDELVKKGVDVFLNLELRLTYQNKEDDCCDLHVIFDSAIEKEKIEKFLSNLTIHVNGDEKKASSLNGDDDFKKGVVEFDKLIETLNEKSLGIKGRYLIGFLSRGKGNSRSSTVCDKITEKADFLIHSSTNDQNLEKDREFWLGYGKPLLQSSDAHQLSSIGEKFSWVKSDTTFEGLKQVVFEPSERVRIQELKPDEKATHLTINRIEYKDSSNAKKVVYLNQNLNSVIGSRAQGKSNLLKNIAYSIDPEQCKLRSVSLNQFFNFKSFKVIWNDLKESELTGGEKEKGVLFIPQGYLGELVYEQDPRFDKFLVNLFENRDDFQKATKDYRKFEDGNVLSITSTIREILTIRGLGIDKQDKLKKLGKKEDLDIDIKQTEEKIEKFGKTASVNTTELKTHERLNSERTQKDKQIKLIEQDIDSFTILKDEEVISSEKILDLEFSKSSFDKIKKKLAESDEVFKKDFVDAEIKNLKKTKDDLLKDIAKLDKEIKPLQDKINKSKALIELTNGLGKKKEVKIQIETLEKELKDLRKEFEAKKLEVVKIYLKFGDEYKNLKVDFGSLKFSQVKIVVAFDVLSLRKVTEDYINFHNSTNFKKDEKGKYKKAIDFLNNPAEWVYEKKDFSQLLNEILDGLLSGQLMLKTGKDLEGTLLELLKNRYKIDFPQSISSKKGVSFPDMSDGEQMLALLEFIFKFDDYNYPVILDQPEDDLDSRAISTTIVDFVKSEKVKRQIIIASHNANLVVCGDSENVILSEKKGRTNPDFSYTWGGIENDNVNKEIVEILEGGKEALKKRMRKLNVAG